MPTFLLALSGDELALDAIVCRCHFPSDLRRWIESALERDVAVLAFVAPRDQLPLAFPADLNRAFIGVATAGKVAVLLGKRAGVVAFISRGTCVDVPFTAYRGVVNPVCGNRANGEHK